MEETISSKIKKFLERETLTTLNDESQNLVDTGVVDSFTLIKLISFIEKEFNLKINLDDIDVVHFQSIRGICLEIEKMRQK